MKIKIAIADSNETYAARLFDALQKQENLSISVYTNKEKMEKEITSVRYDIPCIPVITFSKIQNLLLCCMMRITNFLPDLPANLRL